MCHFGGPAEVLGYIQMSAMRTAMSLSPMLKRDETKPSLTVGLLPRLPLPKGEETKPSQSTNPTSAARVGPRLVALLPRAGADSFGCGGGLAGGFRAAIDLGAGFDEW
jgi:hypothetical protein